MRAARLTSGAEVTAVQVLLAAVDRSWPADGGDGRDGDEAGGGGECVITSADDAGNKRLCGRTDSGLLGVFPSETTVQQLHYSTSTCHPASIKHLIIIVIVIIVITIIITGLLWRCLPEAQH